MTTIKKRRQEKTLTTPGQVPTVPTVADHTLPGWLATDIYIGEWCFNAPDGLWYTRNEAGIVGPVGASASGTTFDITAGESVGGHRVVMISGGKAVYFDPTEEDNAGLTLGISTNAADEDADVTVQQSGLLENLGWGLTQDAVYYAAANGILTTTPPDTGIQIRVGVATDSDHLLIQFSEPLVLI